MKSKKVQMPCWIDPATKAYLEERATREQRDPGNLCALLVEWATLQLKTAGNSLELMGWEAQPGTASKKGRKVG